MFQAMVERIREESVQQVFSFAKQFERALASAEEEAGGSIAHATIAPSSSETDGDEPSVEAVAAAESAASEAAREAVAHARLVMGTVGREKAPTRVRYTSAEGSSESAASPSQSQGNRAERRAAAKKRRRR